MLVAVAVLYRPVGQNEYWIPAEELDEFNDDITGPIEVLTEYRPEQ